MHVHIEARTRAMDSVSSRDSTRTWCCRRSRAVVPRRDVVILTKKDTADTLAGSRAALILCALVATGFAIAAFLASPAGKRPAVVRVTSGARA